ncbi:D-isomer specific 2-hydroxyacid dehydrogenase [Neohortaea acidophila]|uniref:D-isomer specific 2-hydroxyacid dehydrogenase n=1 Tax=Neohortaea acidophila TaxID=245834 RepID=A0A6A6Q863_9PEZI|nr:D-isomer specific 2-hydroxyacid dehydrogenase [Neohortaea acidophila]KAF2487833.1 D-isomer specific 2-hydroxyacid dehydrogenase [Neohortaea acidophila]
MSIGRTRAKTTTYIPHPNSAMNVGVHLEKVAQMRASGTSTTREGPIRLAILDDYQNIARPKFAALLPRIEIHTFTYTLNAHSTSERNELIKRLQPFDVISSMRERTAFPAEVLSALPRLKLLLTTGMRNASIDMQACADRGILVVGTKGSKIKPPPTPPSTQVLSSSLQATAEQTLALILGVTKLIAHNDAHIAHGGWQTGFVSSLAGKTLGVVGLGKIGAHVARMAALGFGMNIVAWSSNLTQQQADERAKEIGLEAVGIRVAASKLDLFREADVISLHYVLSDRSRRMVGSEEVAAMKPSGVLVNTSRGGLIDEPALLAALKQGRIRGVGLDVFTVEPLPSDSEWRTTRWGENGAGYAVLSPHMGYAEEDVIHGWYEETAESLAEWLDGKTPSAVIS